MADVQIESHRQEILDGLENARFEALDEVGARWEDKARELAPVAKWGDELGDSIKHYIEKGELYVGSNSMIAPYAELGTGKEYRPPPEYLGTSDEWAQKYGPGGEENKGKARGGISHWWFVDEAESKLTGKTVFRMGTPQQATPFISKAFEALQDDIKKIMEQALKGSGE